MPRSAILMVIGQGGGAGGEWIEEDEGVGWGKEGAGHEEVDDDGDDDEDKDEEDEEEEEAGHEGSWEDPSRRS